MSYEVRVAIAFAAGHRLLHHPGKCRAPHGHSFVAEIFVQAETLDDLGMVIDFDRLKSQLSGWITTNWDHGFLVNEADVALLAAFEQVPEAKVYVTAGNPSAELMARELFTVARREVGAGVVAVRVWEGDRQYGEYRR